MIFIICNTKSIIVECQIHDYKYKIHHLIAASLEHRLHLLVDRREFID